MILELKFNKSIYLVKLSLEENIRFKANRLS